MLPCSPFHGGREVTFHIVSEVVVCGITREDQLTISQSQALQCQSIPLVEGIMSGTKKWVPLESNPDVLNGFAAKLGLNTKQYHFCDVYGLDQDLLNMVPRPVLAVLVLFPITDKTESARVQQQEAIERERPTVSPSVYYMRQTIGNACGTIGLLHAVGNNLDTLNLVEGSFLSQFYAATETLDSQQRGAFLEHPPQGAPSIDEIHEEAAQQGDTAAPNPDEVVQLHFIVFVHKDGSLYELDGRKTSPINHGATSSESLLEDTAVVVRREYIEKSDSINFNMIALAAAESD